RRSNVEGNDPGKAWAAGGVRKNADNVRGEVCFLNSGSLRALASVSPFVWVGVGFPWLYGRAAAVWKALANFFWVPRSSPWHWRTNCNLWPLLLCQFSCLQPRGGPGCAPDKPAQTVRPPHPV